MNSFPLNSAVRMSVAFTDLNGTPIDPSTIDLYYSPPGGPEVNLIYGVNPIVKDGIGLYHYDVTVTAPGVWLYRYEGSGSVIAATNDNQFSVIGSLLVTT